jgi:hypothetical protein
MWGAENKQAIWALLGSAYSDLRDHHQENLSVEKFLSLTVPMLPIIPADQYLNKMGWYMTSDAATKEPKLERKTEETTTEPITGGQGGPSAGIPGSPGAKNPSNASGEDVSKNKEKYADFNTNIADTVAAINTTEALPDTNLSLADIVDHCYDRGLLQRETRRNPMDLLRTDLANQGLMLLGAPAAGGGGGGPATPPPPCVETPQLNNQQEAIASSPSSVSAGTLTDAQEAAVDAETADTGYADGELPIEAIVGDAYLSIGAVTRDQQAAFDNTDLALHFHPDVLPPILGFDPRVIQNDFDPFDLDLSQFVVNTAE